MNPSVGACSLAARCPTITGSSEFLLAPTPPPVSLLGALRAPPAFSPSSAFLIRDAARRVGLDTADDRVAPPPEELALNPPDDDDELLISLASDRFLDAFTLSFRRASRSRPAPGAAVSPVLLSVSLQGSAGLLLPCGGFFLRGCDLRVVGAASLAAVAAASLWLGVGRPLSVECRVPLQPLRGQQAPALRRELSSLKRRMEPPLVKRRPPTVRRPMCSSMPIDQRIT